MMILFADNLERELRAYRISYHSLSLRRFRKSTSALANAYKQSSRWRKQAGDEELFPRLGQDCVKRIIRCKWNPSPRQPFSRKQSGCSQDSGWF